MTNFENCSVSYDNKALAHYNMPTLVCEDGGHQWFRRDKNHRLDGPAVIYSDGSREWYSDGELYDEEGPTVVESYRVES